MLGRLTETLRLHDLISEGEGASLILVYSFANLSVLRTAASVLQPPVPTEHASEEHVGASEGPV